MRERVASEFYNNDQLKKKKKKEKYIHNKLSRIEIKMNGIFYTQTEE